MELKELEQELKNGNLNSIYLFYGEEEFILETNLKKIKKLFGELLPRNKLYSNRRNKC